MWHCERTTYACSHTCRVNKTDTRDLHETRDGTICLLAASTSRGEKTRASHRSHAGRDGPRASVAWPQKLLFSLSPRDRLLPVVSPCFRDVTDPRDTPGHPGTPRDTPGLHDVSNTHIVSVSPRRFHIIKPLRVLVQPWLRIVIKPLRVLVQPWLRIVIKPLRVLVQPWLRIVIKPLRVLVQPWLRIVIKPLRVLVQPWLRIVIKPLRVLVQPWLRIVIKPLRVLVQPWLRIVIVV